MTVKKYYIKKGGEEYPLHSFEYKKEGNSAVDTTRMTFSRTYDSIFDIGDDVSIGYHNESDSFVADFNGDITRKEFHQELSLLMESYAGRIYRTDYITEVHEDKTIEWIVDFLITNYTTLTYASTGITGITLQRFVLNNETVGEAITRILKDLDWQIRVDNDKNFYFEPKGDVISAVSLVVGKTAFMESDWKKNPNRLTNSCTVSGDKAKFNTNETFSPIATQTEFDLIYKITGNVRVTVNGTEKVGGQEGAIGTFDYSIDREQKKIIFVSGMVGTETVIIYYEYELPIKITARNEESISSFGVFPRKITDNTLKTTSDARKLAKKVVTTFGNPTRSGELRVSWTENVDVGETLQVVDSFNSIDQSFVIVNLTRKYPEGSKIIFVGVEEVNLLDMDKNLNDRIKKLETKQDNTDILQRYLSFTENVNVSAKQGRVRVRVRNIAGNSLIYGSPVFGIWESFKWGSTMNTSFVLGHPSAAILGTSELGSQSSEFTVESVVNFNNIMIERFNFTTYKSDNTTATWDTSGETCTFTVGEIAESLAVYKDTIKTKATFTTEDDTNLTAEMSMDGGENWESVTIGTEHTFSNTGSELRWRLTASGNAETKWVNITYS